MASTAEEPISAAEHISNDEDALKQTTNANPPFPDVSDASLTQKDEVDAHETGSEDAVSAVASEDISRASLDSLAVCNSSSSRCTLSSCILADV